MSTRGNVAIAINGVDARIIYNHFDSYPRNGLGKILKLYYTNKEKVERLINMGDASSIDKFIGTKHDFNHCPDGECNFYGRDRGEDNVDAWTGAIEHSWEGSGADYDYLFKPNTGIWYVRQSYGEDAWRVLTDVECGITAQDKEQAEKEIAEYNKKEFNIKMWDALHNDRYFH